jgi:peptidoglycan hydrolase-like protein with peptidoglycan-binding domain
MRTAFLPAVLVFAVVVAPASAQPLPPPLTYTQPLSPQGVMVVQRRLHEQGVYSGRIDGVWGQDSQTALERFQQTHGLQVTGQLNPAAVATLGVSPDQLLAGTPSPPGQPPPIIGNALSRTSVEAIQSRLRDLNFYTGPVDGIWGGSTEQAIERFQQSRGLQPNGQLNPATITPLGLDPNAMVQSR